ncbi:MAG: putative zinc-binding protein [Candidatus Zipacnadales bacterium]
MTESCCNAMANGLLFSCAGGSNVGQIANDAAIKLEQSGVGRLYCLAGIGGRVEGMVKHAQSVPFTVVIDGCSVCCARKTLEQVGIEPTIHTIVTELGIKKEHTYEYPPEDVERVVDAVLNGSALSSTARPAEDAACCGDSGTEESAACCQS